MSDLDILRLFREIQQSVDNACNRLGQVERQLADLTEVTGDRLIPSSEAAEVLGMANYQVNALVKDGKLRGVCAVGSPGLVRSWGRLRIHEETGTRDGTTPTAREDKTPNTEVKDGRLTHSRPWRDRVSMAIPSLNVASPELPSCGYRRSA